MTSINKPKLTAIRITFGENAMQKIDFLQKKYSMDSPGELIKFLIADQFKEVKSNVMRYGDPDNKKVSQRQLKEDKEREDKEYHEERTKALSAMTNEQKTEYLMEIGFMHRPLLMESHPLPLGERWMRTYMGDGSDGNPAVFAEYYHPNEVLSGQNAFGEPEVYPPTITKAETLTWGELLEKLKARRWDKGSE